MCNFRYIERKVPRAQLGRFFRRERDGRFFACYFGGMIEGRIQLSIWRHVTLSPPVITCQLCLVRVVSRARDIRPRRIRVPQPKIREIFSNRVLRRLHAKFHTFPNWSTVIQRQVYILHVKRVIKNVRVAYKLFYFITCKRWILIAENVQNITQLKTN